MVCVGDSNHSDQEPPFYFILLLTCFCRKCRWKMLQPIYSSK